MSPKPPLPEAADEASEEQLPTMLEDDKNIFMHLHMYPNSADPCIRRIIIPTNRELRTQFFNELKHLAAIEELCIKNDLKLAVPKFTKTDMGIEIIDGIDYPGFKFPKSIFADYQYQPLLEALVAGLWKKNRLLAKEVEVQRETAKDHMRQKCRNEHTFCRTFNDLIPSEQQKVQEFLNKVHQQQQADQAEAKKRMKEVLLNTPIPIGELIKIADPLEKRYLESLQEDIDLAQIQASMLESDGDTPPFMPSPEGGNPPPLPETSTTLPSSSDHRSRPVVLPMSPTIQRSLFQVGNLEINHARPSISQVRQISGMPHYAETYPTPPQTGWQTPGPTQTNTPYPHQGLSENIMAQHIMDTTMITPPPMTAAYGMPIPYPPGLMHHVVPHDQRPGPSNRPPPPNLGYFMDEVALIFTNFQGEKLPNSKRYPASS
ncbi:unnamed protein product, partial [Mesorhabditis spiculigera]